MKKEQTKYVGFGLILGVAIGFGFGLIITTPTYAPVFGGFGAGLGIVFGAMVSYSKTKKKESKQ